MRSKLNFTQKIFSLATVISFIITLGWQLTMAMSDDDEVYGIVTTESTALNIRADRGTDTKIIAKALNGSRLRILETIGSWYKVQLSHGKTGYVSADYIKISHDDTNESTATTAQITPYQTHLNQGNLLNDQRKIKAAYQEYLKAYKNASTQREQEIALGSLVATASQLGNNPLAEKYLKELLAISPDNEWAKKFAEQITPPAIKPEVAEPRTALVIGNADYADGPLNNPINDAKAIIKLLENRGFKVFSALDADQRRMETTINEFATLLAANKGIGVFYYSGHGLQVDGENYLIPINAEITDETDVKYKAIDAGQVLGKMESAKNNLNIVILDACRVNPWLRGRGNNYRGLATMQAHGTLIAYATAPNSIASDGNEEDINGLYTKHLLKAMQTPGWEIEKMFKQVGIAVENESKGEQSPWYHSSLRGEFCFSGCKTPATPLKIPIPSPTVTQAQVPGRYPETSIRYLNDADLEGKSAYELKIMRNEIFARRGYLFEPGKMRDYFNNQPWYQPRYSDVGSFLSPIEQANIQRIKEYE
ncbi:MAG: YARHG domain-containing protein [Thioploca sp.]|nr:YARHG domain-containing protein [Thioploca sp.]